MLKDMTNTERQYVEKLKELIKCLDDGFCTEMVCDWQFKEKHKLESEIAKLEQQIKSERCDAIIETVKEA
jgi:hypothetical protein